MAEHDKLSLRTIDLLDIEAASVQSHDQLVVETKATRPLNTDAQPVQENRRPRSTLRRNDSAVENILRFELKPPEKPETARVSWRASSHLASFELAGQRRSDKSDELLGLHKFDEPFGSQWSVSSPASSFDTSPGLPILKKYKGRAETPTQTKQRSSDIRKILDALSFGLLKPTLRPSRRVLNHMESDQWKSAAVARTSWLEPESVLVLSLRCGRGGCRVRTTTLTVPAFQSLPSEAQVRGSRSITFDDEDLFAHIRSHYALLGGRRRLLSARSLQRIVVQGRSPHDFARPGEDESYSCTETKLLQLFRKPAIGRGKFTFVQWARRIANVPTLHILQSDEYAGDVIDLEGLEFVVAWSRQRVIFALAVVLLMTVAIPLLWAAVSDASSIPMGFGGYQAIHGRSAAAALLGFCVFVVGMTCTGVWIILSWLLM